MVFPLARQGWKPLTCSLSKFYSPSEPGQGTAPTVWPLPGVGEMLCMKYLSPDSAEYTGDLFLYIRHFYRFSRGPRLPTTEPLTIEMNSHLTMHFPLLHTSGILLVLTVFLLFWYARFPSPPPPSWLPCFGLVHSAVALPLERHVWEHAPRGRLTVPSSAYFA